MPKEWIPRASTKKILEWWANLPLRGLEQVTTMAGAVGTKPWRMKERPPWYAGIAPPAYLAQFYPGGKEYKEYQAWKGTRAEPSLPLGIPGQRQLAGWVGLGEKPEQYEQARLGVGDIAEMAPWLFMGGGGKVLPKVGEMLRPAKPAMGVVPFVKPKAKPPIPTVPKPIAVKPTAPKVTPVTPTEYELMPVAEALKIRQTQKNFAQLSDRELRRQLGEGTEGWSQVVYERIKSRKTVMVYRVVPKNVDKISIGDRVTHSKESAELVARELYSPGEYRILSIKASPEDLVVQMPNESLYIPKSYKAGIPQKVTPVTPEVTVPSVADKIDDPVLKKLATVMEEQKVARRVTTKVRKPETARRAVEAEEAFQTELRKSGDINKAWAMARSKLKGVKPISTEALGETLTPEELVSLRLKIVQSPEYSAVTKQGLRFYERNRADLALNKLLATDEVLQPNEIKLLNRIFPGIEELNVLKARMGTKLWTNIVDALNLPKAVLASTDLSATLRQGGPLLARRPQLFPGMMKQQFKTLFSDKNWQITDDIMRADPDFAIFDEFGGYFAPKPGGIGPLYGREETFMSRLAERIPAFGRVVKASERAFTSGLNYLRFKSFKANLANFRKIGATTEADMEGLVKLVNWASGRGDFPKALRAYAPAVNALMFAPRFVSARLQLPLLMLPQKLSAKLGLPIATRAVRKEATRTLVQFFGAGLSILGLASMTGAKIETDPRSSDFGKIRVKNTRLDIWSGYVQWARFLSQLATAQRKIVSTGKIAEARRWDVMWNLIQSKESPMASIFTDLLKGETYLGEPIFEGGWDTLRRELRNRLTPLFVQDLWDAIETDGLAGGLAAAPGFLGVGVVSYKPKEEKYKWIKPSAAKKTPTKSGERKWVK